MHGKIVFGAGKYGKNVYEKLGENNIVAFCDNDIKKINKTYLDKKIISFEQIITLNESFEMVIASNYVEEIGKQLCNAGIYEFYIWNSRQKDILKVNAKDKVIANYMQIRIVDHCNLNCKNCGSICNKTVKPWSISIEDFETDLKRLRELFCYIKTIRLLGGEPLLHEDLGSIIYMTRKYFPETDIKIATNGLKIPKLQKEILDIISKLDIEMDITIYKPTSLICEDIVKILNENSIKWESHDCNGFRKWITESGNKNQQRAWELCGAPHDCRNLKKGILSRCSMAEAYEKINKQFNKNYVLIENDDYINIHKSDIDIIKQWEIFSNAGSMCSYCIDRPIEVFEWEAADGIICLDNYVITDEEYRLISINELKV